jgi:hypothetical protein
LERDGLKDMQKCRKCGNGRDHQKLLQIIMLEVLIVFVFFTNVWPKGGSLSKLPDGVCYTKSHQHVP